MSVTKSDYKTPDIGDRSDWIIRLLYAPNPQGTQSPIYGRTRIMKACFLISRKMDEIFGKQTDFEFEAHKYGPFDPGVYEALEHLEETGYILVTPEKEHGTRYDGAEYKLTPDGRELGKELWDIDEEERSLVEWVKYEKSMQELGELLSYVYRKYPRMTDNSEIKDRVTY